MRTLALALACPYLDALRAREATLDPLVPAPGYLEALGALDLPAVKRDLVTLFTDSQDWWPADYGTYAPFFVRLAWHCSGSYRTSDGRGGCDGGRQRFEPERSWADNTNLDKARKLLWPLKEKYGLGLSWGDLFILAGTTAIEHMGGPVLGFCAGRLDAQDGAETQALGPSALQEALFPCPVNGKCKKPLGSTTIGLIYLNPEGPMAKPDPAGSALDIRDAFGRMAMNDTETVALIGGGHAFGKTHGACPKGAGPSPKEDPANPWPGKCGTGKGKDAFTSGFEGPWTTTPTQWSNEFFTGLLENDWEVHLGPGGHNQWRAKGQGKYSGVMRLTSDISLLHDPKYREIAETFAKDKAQFEHAFKHAWYKLTTRDMGPVERCVGSLVPPAQPFQYPLPAPPANPASPAAVAAALEEELGALKVGEAARLALSCALTFRQTDRQGGCSGLRLRFAPEKEWASNEGLEHVLKALEPVRARVQVSVADLAVAAGTLAVGAGPSCLGRSDALDGAGSEHLVERFPGRATSAEQLKYDIQTLGLSLREFVALLGVRALDGFQLPGFAPFFAQGDREVSNRFFRVLAAATAWTSDGPDSPLTATVGGETVQLMPQDYLLVTDPELQAIAQDFAADGAQFLVEFRAAWTKLMNADRFQGPAGNVCAAAPEAEPEAPAAFVI